MGQEPISKPQESLTSCSNQNKDFNYECRSLVLNSIDCCDDVLLNLDAMSLAMVNIHDENAGYASGRLVYLCECDIRDQLLDLKDSLNKLRDKFSTSGL